jgi:NAD(P)-dependent dehydrogenase (short-subunit alcohol dehydrogenase family)
MIFISSELGVKTPHEMTHYGALKAAQIAVARGIAETTTGTEVMVNRLASNLTNHAAYGCYFANWRPAPGFPLVKVPARKIA